MAEVTVKQLAGVVGTSVDRLLEQIKDAGLTLDNPDSLISDVDKMTLLGFLRGQHGKDSDVESENKPKKIALKRKTVSAVKASGGRGGPTIEVRRKRTITRPVVPDVVEPAAESESGSESGSPQEAPADRGVHG